MSDSGGWWHQFFTGLAVDVWLNATTTEQTQHEADFIAESLDVAAPAKILDVPCGGGRHSIVLASRGYAMTAVDRSAEFLTAARSQSAGLPSKIDWQERDMRDLPWPETFAGAFCFGNSFGYLDEDGNAAFLKSVATALKPGAGSFSKRAMSWRDFYPRCKSEVGTRSAICTCWRSGATIPWKAGSMLITSLFAAVIPRRVRCRRGSTAIARSSACSRQRDLRALRHMAR